MAFLPSGYIACSGIGLINSCYIDTGIVPDSSYSVEALFGDMSTSGWVFGARNSNSSTAQGQLNYNCSSSTNYIGYNATRLSFSDSGVYGYPFIRFAKFENTLEVTKGVTIASVTGSTSDFTGSRNIYIGALNNGGTLTKNTSVILFGFIVKSGSTLICDLVPCYKTATNEQGVYDLKSKTFIGVNDTPRTLHKLTIESSEGGTGYAKTYHGENVKEIYCTTNFSEPLKARLIAIAEGGYVFKNWTDSNGNVVSTEKEIEYSPTGDGTIKANFIKKASADLGTGFRTLAMRYRYPNAYQSHQDEFYADVVSASVKYDALQKTVTTIIVRDMPSIYRENIPIFMLNSRNEVVYEGFIQSIDGNTITCREPLSLFDNEFLFHPNNSLADSENLRKRTMTYSFYKYMGWAVKNTDTSLGDQARIMKDSMFSHVVISESRVGRLKQMNILDSPTPPITETKVGNLEEFMLSTFTEYNVFPKVRLKDVKRTGDSYFHHAMDITTETIDDKEKITISDNYEKVSDVAITLENVAYTVLVVFNSAGTSLRGIYGMENDGSIVAMEYPNSVNNQDLISQTKYLAKLVMSDDDMNTLIYQNLANAKFNHKITFKLDLNNSFYGVNTIEIGQPVNFYYKDKLYESVVTGKSFEINENQNEVNTMSLTLGKVRTNITSKLNIRK